MTKEQINKLISEGGFLEETVKRELIETHISWVILCDEYVYKIKKPVDYSFLDFSTIELHKQYCKREIILNQRLPQNMYLEVLPIHVSGNTINIGGEPGPILYYR